MIKKISSIDKFGIYNKYTPNDDLYDFERYNLIYGWNGSGKSTLSKLFYSVYSKELPLEFSTSEFNLETSDKTISSKLLKDTNINISVFNEQFISENIDWNNLVKSLLYISKGKLEDKLKLNQVINESKDIDIEINKLSNSNEKITEENNNSRQSIAKFIKTKMEEVKSDESKRIYYDIRNFTKLIESNPDLRKSKLLISESKFNEHKYLPQLDFLEFIEDIGLKEIEVSEIKSFISNVKKIIKKKIFNTIVSSFTSEENKWIENGIHLHSESDNCKFCDNTLTKKRLMILSQMFNDNFYDTKNEIEKCLADLEKFRIKDSLNQDEIIIYPFLNEEFLYEQNILKNKITEINLFISLIEDSLKDKKDNLFKNSVFNIDFNSKLFYDYNSSIIRLNKLISNHNHISQNFKNKTQEAFNIYELYFGQRELKNHDYFSKQVEYEINVNLINSLSLKKESINKKIKILESSLKDEVLGAEEFNVKLHRFLNHADISLEFDDKQSGYKILRRKGKIKEIAKNLSEGEKTAISFVFFMTKLQEDKEKLKSTIVVIDDPISSFDSNHLFNAYSYIRNICNDVRQLFILTHNFMFFRLIRDWIKDKQKKLPDRTTVYNYRIYNLVNEYCNNERRCRIINIDKTLLEYNSEYHYLFSRLFSYREAKKIELNECFLISNMTRKILEIFLNFKFPKRRNDFMNLLTAALPLDSDRIKREKIYRFVNKYSHGDKIESFDDTIDNIMSESNNIVKEVLYLIRKMDKKHYDELVEITVPQ